MSMRDMLLVAPGHLLSVSIEEVELPTRMAKKLTDVNTVGDLLRYKPEELLGRNLGARTIEDATTSLKEFFKRKIEGKDYSTAPLREQMQDYAKDLLAREARIWEMRMGLKKERFTLEATGEKFGLTRERVRQIEAVLFDVFSKRFPAAKMVGSAIKEGMSLADLIKATDGLINPKDTLPLVGLLENLPTKFYLIEEYGDPIVSTTSRSTFEVTVRQALVNLEKEFRNSEVPLKEEDCLNILKRQKASGTALYLAASKLTKDGHWLNDKLLSPNSDKTNLAVGILQGSPRPMHLEEITGEIFRITKDSTTTETLRSCLSVVPAIRSFGFSTVGFTRHTFLNLGQVKSIIKTVERVIQKGPEGFQWSAIDLLNVVREKFPTIDINHHQLNVILQESDKLQYLGRLTWSDNTVKERTIYRDLFRSILKAAGKPLDTESLMAEARKHRGFVRENIPDDKEIIQVKPGIWGLANRDHPFTKAEVERMLAVFDDSFGQDFSLSILHARGIDTKGLSDADIIKVMEAAL